MVLARIGLVLLRVARVLPSIVNCPGLVRFTVPLPRGAWRSLPSHLLAARAGVGRPSAPPARVKTVAGCWFDTPTCTVKRAILVDYYHGAPELSVSAHSIGVFRGG
jgi:hypothetical protein